MNLLGDGAKPWKADLSSDGLSDVGTPIFCLRRGKSETYVIRRETVAVASNGGGCLQASAQRKRFGALNTPPQPTLHANWVKGEGREKNECRNRV